MNERHDTTPGIQPIGTPAAGAPGHPPAGDPYATTPQYTTQPVAVRRPDVLAGLLLLLAGAAAAFSLVLDWLVAEKVTGLDLVRDGFATFDSGVGQVFTSGLWQPLLAVLGGGALAVLGLLMFVPARTHRALGLLALIITVGVVAAVLVPLARAGWDTGVFDVGFWFAVAVAGLGLLGSLKAVATGLRFETAPARTA
jgi:hypothetical protein